MSVIGDSLFTSGGGASLDAMLRHQAEQVLPKLVQDIPETEFVSLRDEEAIARVVKEVRFEPLELVLDQAVNRADEVFVDVSGRQDIMPFFGRPAEIKGFAVVKAIPFKGHQDLWFLQPNTFDFNPPRGEISGRIIRIGIEVIERELDQAKSYIIGELGKINKYITAQKSTLDRHNAMVFGLASLRVKERRDRLNKAANFLKDF